jgi:hypothetical protein
MKQIGNLFEKENNTMKQKMLNKFLIPIIYVGDKVLIRRGTENKYEAPYEGPYTISQKSMTMVQFD